MKNHFFLFAFFSLIITSASAQAGITGRKINLDSLENLLRKAKEDTNKVILLNTLATEYKLKDPDKGIITAIEAFTLAEKLHFPQGEMSACNQLGIIYKNKSEYEKALSYYTKGLEIGRTAGLKVLSAKISANIGSIYSNQGNYPKAIEYYVGGLELFIKLNDKKSISACESNIGIIYSRMHKSETAIDYYRKSLAIRKEINDVYGIANDLNNMAIEFGFIAADSKKIADYDTSLSYYQRSLRILEDFGDKQGIAHTYDNMAQVYIEYGKLSGNKKMFSEAEELIRKALAINEDIEDQSGIAACNSNLGALYGELGQPDKAIECYRKALEISRKIGELEWIRDNYHGLAMSYLSKKDHQKALENFMRYSDVKDSILNETGTKQIAEMQTKYETVKKENEIQVLQQKNDIQELEASKQRTLRNSIIGGLIFVLLMSGLLYNRYLVKKKANEGLSEKNKVIEEKNENLQTAYSIIVEKNKNITDSINYAKRI